MRYFGEHLAYCKYTRITYGSVESWWFINGIYYTVFQKRHAQFSVSLNMYLWGHGKRNKG
jgi:hypothetical protein